MPPERRRRRSPLGGHPATARGAELLGRGCCPSPQPVASRPNKGICDQLTVGTIWLSSVLGIGSNPSRRGWGCGRRLTSAAQAAPWGPTQAATGSNRRPGACPLTPRSQRNEVKFPWVAFGGSCRGDLGQTKGYGKWQNRSLKNRLQSGHNRGGKSFVVVVVAWAAEVGGAAFTSHAAVFPAAPATQPRLQK